MLPSLTERTTVRRLDVSDLANFQRYRTDPEVARYQGWSPMSAEAAVEFLAEMSMAKPFEAGEWFQLGIADRESNQLIGDIGIHISRDEAEALIGFTLSAEWQGKGIAFESVGAVISEMWEVTPVSVIRGVSDLRNTRSIRLLKKLGMQLERTEETYFHGEQCVEVTYRLERAVGTDF